MTKLLWNIRNEFSQTLERWWWLLFWLQIFISLPIWAKWPFFGSFFYANGVFGKLYVYIYIYTHTHTHTHKHTHTKTHTLHITNKLYTNVYKCNMFWKSMPVWTCVHVCVYVCVCVCVCFLHRIHWHRCTQSCLPCYFKLTCLVCFLSREVLSVPNWFLLYLWSVGLYNTKKMVRDCLYKINQNFAYSFFQNTIVTNELMLRW